MKSPRFALRAAITAVSLSTLLTAAACGGSENSPGSGGGSTGSVDFSQKGPIEFWRGKDVSGVVPKLIDEFNATHPGETVTLHELPDAADAQRQQIILNNQQKNPRMAVV